MHIVEYSVRSSVYYFDFKSDNRILAFRPFSPGRDLPKISLLKLSDFVSLYQYRGFHIRVSHLVLGWQPLE